jgi:hypothetical protein
VLLGAAVPPAAAAVKVCVCVCVVQLPPLYIAATTTCCCYCTLSLLPHVGAACVLQLPSHACVSECCVSAARAMGLLV